MEAVKIVDAVVQFYGISHLYNYRSSVRMSLAKWAAVYLLRTETQLPLRVIAELTGYKAPACVSCCWDRSLQELKVNKMLLDDMVKIKERLKATK